jgi:hypothetical protein
MKNLNIVSTLIAGFVGGAFRQWREIGQQRPAPEVITHPQGATS